MKRTLEQINLAIVAMQEAFDNAPHHLQSDLNKILFSLYLLEAKAVKH